MKRWIVARSQRKKIKSRASVIMRLWARREEIKGLMSGVVCRKFV
jgi:hypothetical protein